MKKRERKWSTAASVLLIIFAMVLSGCGSSSIMSSEAFTGESAMDMATDYAYEESVGMDNGSADSKVNESATSTNRKLIKNVEMSIETQEYETLMANIQSEVDSIGGYIENMSAYNNSSYYSEGLRSADMIIRVPSDKLDSFLTHVAERSNITYRNESVTDVTLQYVDIESRKNALTAEEQRLLEFMERAETIEDLITIENSLTEVRYELESIESQLRVYDNQIDYSTVSLYISEVKLFTPETPESTWEEIRTGFVHSVQSIGNGVVDIAVWFVIHIPYIAIFVIIVVVILLIIRMIHKGRMKKNAKRGGAQGKTYPQNNQPVFLNQPQSNQQQNEQNQSDHK